MMMLMVVYVAPIPYSQYYPALLTLIEQFFAGKHGGSHFEDKVRLMFGTKGYLMFTIDKLIQSLARQVFLPCVYMC